LRRRKGVFVGSGEEVAKWWRAREVPLMLAGGRLITLGARPPNGLTLVIKTRPGTKVDVSSGSVTRRGDALLVSPKGPTFRARVSGGG
jgi:hypothetical protein